MEETLAPISIYYFSGTGNSLYVAKKIAERVRGRLAPIAAVIEQEEIEDDADTIGIVFPVYLVDLPGIVGRFAGKLKDIESKYIFAVPTYGGGKGLAIKSLDSLIGARGGKLSAIYGIHMPLNCFRNPLENRRMLDRKAKKMVERIGRNLEQGKGGAFYTSLIADIVQRPLNRFLEPLGTKSLMKLTHSPGPKPKEELMHLADVTFGVTSECNGCGICGQVCPVSNIRIDDDKPVWLNRCENCLACYNYCPKRAIQTELVPKGYFYKHPEISLKEMIAQKDKPGSGD